jgi:hypothetical protein
MSYSDIARNICPPRDRQAKAAPARTGRAARARVGSFDSPARRRDVLLRLANRVNAAEGVLTVAEQLRERGADGDLVRRYASPVGRKTAAVWRETHDGAGPAQIGLAAAGRRGLQLLRVSGYRAEDRELLDAVIDVYQMPDPRAPKSRKAPRVHLTDLIGA